MSSPVDRSSDHAPNVMLRAAHAAALAPARGVRHVAVTASAAPTVTMLDALTVAAPMMLAGAPSPHMVLVTSRTGEYMVLAHGGALPVHAHGPHELSATISTPEGCFALYRGRRGHRDVATAARWIAARPRSAVVVALFHLPAPAGYAATAPGRDAT